MEEQGFDGFDGCGANDKNFSFIIVELEEIGCEAGFLQRKESGELGRRVRKLLGLN